MPIHEKSQAVRLLDVLAIGPLLVYAGAKKSDLSTGLRTLLVGVGVGTIGYNLYNYMGNKPTPGELVGIDPEELQRGTIHELEHTTDFDIAKRIALDHLMANPLYYSQMRSCGL